MKIHMKLTHVSRYEVDLAGYCGKLLHNLLKVSVMLCHLLCSSFVINIHGHVSNVPRHQHQVNPAEGEETNW